MDISNLTDEELEAARQALNAEINKRKESERKLAKEELARLLDRVNELQYKLGFEISCRDDDGDWISCATDFELEL